MRARTREGSSGSVSEGGVPGVSRRTMASVVSAWLASMANAERSDISATSGRPMVVLGDVGGAQEQVDARGLCVVARDA
jgi:hypothetical protein